MRADSKAFAKKWWQVGRHLFLLCKNSEPYYIRHWPDEVHFGNPHGYWDFPYPLVDRGKIR